MTAVFRILNLEVPNRATTPVRFVIRPETGIPGDVRGMGKFPGRFAIWLGPSANCLRCCCLPPAPGAPANKPNMLSLGTAMSGSSVVYSEG